jgi:hypothetical protein
VYDSPAYPQQCWTPLTNPSGITFFVSIATGNANLNGAWATDNNGNIWTVN